MNLDPVMARLTERLLWAEHVGSAVDFGAAAARLQFADHLYVIDFGERGRSNQRINGHRQQVDVSIAVVHFTQSANDPTGGDAMRLLDQRRRAVIAALAGFQPEPDCEPFDFVSGELIRFMPTGLLWSDRFSTSYQLVITNG